MSISNRLIALLLVFLLPLLVVAKPGAGIDIDTFQVISQKEAFIFNAEIEYRLNNDLQEALDHGLKLYSYFNISLGKHRSWWWDSKQRVKQIPFVLRYHSLSKQYILTRGDTEQNWNFRSAARALKQMGNLSSETIEQNPAKLTNNNYYFFAEVTMTTEKLSFPLKLETYLTNKYNMESEGVMWSLP